MNQWMLALVGGLWVFAMTMPSFSYQEAPVTNGGSIRGQVTIIGDKPRPMAFNLVTIPDAVYCGRISTGTGWRIAVSYTHLTLPTNREV